MVVHWNSKYVPLHQIWSLSLNNIMFFLRSTSFVILKFTKHFDAIDEEYIELVMSLSSSYFNILLFGKLKLKNTLS